MDAGDNSVSYSPPAEDDDDDKRKKARHGHSPGADAEARRRPGWKSWASAVAALAFIILLFYGALAIAEDFVVKHAGEAAWGLICFIAGSVATNLFYKDGKALRPTGNQLVAHLPAGFAVVLLAIFLMYWSEGERLIAEENKLCPDLDKPPKAEDAFAELTRLEEQRRTRWLPTRSPDQKCLDYMKPR